ncbi:hypothetical protein [Vibrio phage vB_VmeM-Yong XC32]|nr:hypothetical protein [Vibrio phage vB_VmeM-Yong XC31]QAX96487.1 hypothetical protein [Vibrio phage vB_VmeM-Yong XC32]QAX96804.1 hypothetical protein [Vibrio phage vB_VmeM-Yong MS31]QAX97123.1 hypothetical protein [Vibrio phage vB_VmeM-Yong MS32]
MKKILLLNDMDEFACNWRGPVCERYGYENIREFNDKSPEERQEIMQHYYAENPSAFKHLEILPGFKELWESQLSLEAQGFFTLGWLTAFGLYPNPTLAKSTKQQWIIRNLPNSAHTLEHFHIVQGSGEKAAVMNQLQQSHQWDEVWLLDDFIRNCDQVNNHPNPHIRAFHFRDNYDALDLQVEEAICEVNKNA